MTRLLAEQPPIPRYDRKKQSDREILDLIAERLAQDAGNVGQPSAARVPGRRTGLRAAPFQPVVSAKSWRRRHDRPDPGPVLKRRALRVTQACDAPLYLLSLDGQGRSSVR